MSKKKKLVKKNEKVVKSINNNIRSSVRKLNPILKGIVGKKVELAIRDLQFSEKRITRDIRKTISSAIANAENNFQYDIDKLVVKEAYCGKKITMKRFRPRAKGRAAPILKPYSSVTIILSEAKAPVGNYVATKITGKMLFISGQISIDDNGKLIKGKVGKELDVTAGYNAAKRCALSIIAQVKKACENDLSKIKSCVKLTGFVNSTDDFIDQPKVINGASDLIVSIFGDTGMHTRAAVSTNSLPLGVSVEVDAIFELN